MGQQAAHLITRSMSGQGRAAPRPRSRSTLQTATSRPPTNPTGDSPAGQHLRRPAGQAVLNATCPPSQSALLDGTAANAGPHLLIDQSVGGQTSRDTAGSFAPTVSSGIRSS